MKVTGITFIALLTALIGSARAAPSELPTFGVPDTSDPAVAAFVAWHAALVKGEFAVYRDLTPVLPNVTNDLLKQMFDQLRLTAPKAVKITAPELSQGGSVEFHSIGCNGSQPVVSVVIVRKIDQAWRVGGSGWGHHGTPRYPRLLSVHDGQPIAPEGRSAGKPASRP